MRKLVTSGGLPETLLLPAPVNPPLLVWVPDTIFRVHPDAPFYE